MHCQPTPTFYMLKFRLRALVNPDHAYDLNFHGWNLKCNSPLKHHKPSATMHEFSIYGFRSERTISKKKKKNIALQL